MSRVVAEDNRQSLIVSGPTTLYAVCNTQQLEGAPLFIESKATFACTTDCEPSENFRSRGYTSRKYPSDHFSNFYSLRALMSVISVSYAVRSRQSALRRTYSRDPEGSFVHQSQSSFSPIPRGISWLHSIKYRALHE